MTSTTNKRRFHFGLLPRILVAIGAGILAGWFAPLWCARLCVTFSDIFSQLLGFFVPLIIVGFVTPAIADLGRNAGKMLVFTALLAYAATLCAGFGSYAVSDWLFPSLITADPALASVEQQASEITPWFTMPIPPLMGVMTALVSAFLFGLGIAYCDSRTLRSAASELRDIVAVAINKVIIPLLPFYIFAIFLNMTVAGEVATVLKAFASIIVVIFVMHVLLLVIQYCVASLFCRRNPFKLLWTMMPAYFTALGTQSSAATIPVTLKQTIKMGVSEEIAGFTVPLCATIHMSGSTLKIVACALALMIMEQIPYDLLTMTHFIAMLGVTIIAAPGIPGGAIMASLGLLSGILGFDPRQTALMIALYIAMDSFGTACNVTGDGALSIIVDYFFGHKKRKTITDEQSA